jgi:hypothetical protein
MATSQSLDVAHRAKKIYEDRLRTQLEAKHIHAFVAVEPDSGEFFIGETLSEAIQAAKRAHPNRLSFAIRIGHPTAVNLGVLST